MLILFENKKNKICNSKKMKYTMIIQLQMQLNTQHMDSENVWQMIKLRNPFEVKTKENKMWNLKKKPKL